jgi:hypothetical protein
MFSTLRRIAQVTRLHLVTHYCAQSIIAHHHHLRQATCFDVVVFGQWVGIHQSNPLNALRLLRMTSIATMPPIDKPARAKLLGALAKTPAARSSIDVRPEIGAHTNVR